MTQIARSRTVLIIAHRLSTLRMADRIVTIESGRIVEDGTHEQLMRRGGRYATLHRLQSGLPEVAGMASAAGQAMARSEARTLPTLAGHQPSNHSPSRGHEPRRDAVG